MCVSLSTICIVDDDPKTRRSLTTALTRQGYSVSEAASPKEFIDSIDDAEPAVAIVDIFFGEGVLDGQDLLTYIAERIPGTQCIVISGESDLEKTLACLKAGAIDFIEKPVSLPRLLASVKNAVALHHYRQQEQSRSMILGTSDAVVKMVHRTRKLATLNETVLVRGESGSGKELVAENLHLWSHRSAFPLVKINCTALNPNLIESELFGHKAGSFTGADKDRPGLFESGRGGTVFIDEIGDFPLHLQSKILRVLQERTVLPVGSSVESPIDVRFVFATHRNLEEMVAAGMFREDLLYRISTFTVSVPPLRDRIGDIGMLAAFFLNQFLVNNRLPPMTLSEDAYAKLATYHYPGNIRELSSIVKNAAFNADGEIIRPEHIDFGQVRRHDNFWKEVDTMPLDEAIIFFKGRMLCRRMELHDKSIKKVAESLSILPNNLYRHLKAHEIPYAD